MDLSLYLQQMGKDKRVAALPQTQQEDLVQTALTYGETQGMKLRQTMAEQGCTFPEVVRQSGVTIQAIDTKYDLPYIAEYTAKTKTITLYKRRIAEMQAVLAEIHPQYFETHTLEELSLAHEFFHHLERLHHGATGKLIAIDCKWGGLIPYRHFLDEGSEIAAHRFVTVLFDLPYSTYTFSDELKQAYGQ